VRAASRNGRAHPVTYYPFPKEITFACGALLSFAKKPEDNHGLSAKSETHYENRQTSACDTPLRYPGERHVAYICTAVSL
jgi:hypothetical protein